MCGVFAIYGHAEAANLTYLGLHALQHRGQESAGIVTSDGRQLFAHRAMGLVHDVFSQEQLARLPGPIAIGHVRYSTAGGSDLKNAHGVASEPTASDLIGAQFVRDVEPGEMVVLDAAGVRSVRLPDMAQPHMCVFEYVYFARPDSHLGGRGVYEVRKALGERLAR